MGRKVYIKDLINNGICHPRAVYFWGEFKDSAEATEENCIKYCDEFCWSWVADIYLSEEGKAEYRERSKKLLDERHEVLPLKKHALIYELKEKRKELEKVGDPEKSEILKEIIQRQTELSAIAKRAVHEYNEKTALLFCEIFNREGE